MSCVQCVLMILSIENHICIASFYTSVLLPRWLCRIADFNAEYPQFIDVNGRKASCLATQVALSPWNISLVVLSSHPTESKPDTWSHLSVLWKANRRKIALYDIIWRKVLFNSLGPSDAIWRQKTGSKLAQVMASCLTTPSHYLNQCWLIISSV